VGQFRQFVEATGYKTDGEKSGDGGWGFADGKWERRAGHVWKTPGPWTLSEDQPVVHVSYDDARAFTEWLSQREGRDYTLPDELRWEYAARAGTTGLYGGGDERHVLNAAAWFRGNLPDKRPQQPQPVGTKAANAFGLHDTLGNVWEWCSDVPEHAPSQRILRGGSWYANDFDARVNARGGGAPNMAWDAGTGFRVLIVGDLKPKSLAPFTDADVRRIAALPAAQQVEEVRKELKRRNPGFDGQMEHKIEGGVVTQLRIVSDQVTDIAPIRVFDALRALHCRGTHTYKADHTFKSNGLLADLTPLEGMNLWALISLNLSNTKVGDAGMVHFKDCKNLLELDLWNTKVTDAGLAHFKDCKGLTDLTLGATRVSDTGLVQFHDCKALKRLNVGSTKVSDAGLANFKDRKDLTFLWVQDTQVGDAGLAHFQDCKALSSLNLAGTKVSDVGLAHFKGCKNLKYLYVDRSQVGDAGLAQFKGMRLMELNIANTAITDLTPLQGMPLEHVRLTPKNITRGLDILHDMKSLKTIGIEWRQAWPTAEFWQRYDRGEFK
jgi:hypothetical protein